METWTASHVPSKPFSSKEFRQDPQKVPWLQVPCSDQGPADQALGHLYLWGTSSVISGQVGVLIRTSTPSSSSPQRTGELVRRRGRWASHTVMEIFLQEVAASFFPRLSRQVPERVFKTAQAFPLLLRKAQHFSRLGIPSSSWFFLWNDC